MPDIALVPALIYLGKIIVLALGVGVTVGAVGFIGTATYYLFTGIDQR